MGQRGSDRPHRTGWLVAAAVALASASGLVACQLPGHQLVVTTTADGRDADPGDGVCEATPGTGDCTLRAAVMEANAEPGTNDIEIGDGRTYEIGVPPGGGPPDLVITDSVSVNGSSTVDSQTRGRAIDLQAGTLVLTDTMIRSTINSSGVDEGAGIRVASAANLLAVRVDFDGDDLTGSGGAIFNAGRTTVIDSTFVDDNAGPHLLIPTGQDFPGGGGAIFTSGPLTVRGSTFQRNRADDAHGSVILARGSAEVHVATSTIVGSSTFDAFAGDPTTTWTIADSTFSNVGAGPATPFSIAIGQPNPGVLSGGTYTITATTIADSRGPLVASSDTTVNLGGSVVSTTSPACDALVTSHITSAGYNVVADSSCGLHGVADRQGTNPLLGLLGDHGGATTTFLPFANSPAVDAIPFPTPGLCEAGATDQRGAPRPLDGRCDSGAVEGPSNQSAFPLHLVVTNPNQTLDTTPGNGVCDGGAGGCSLNAAIDETNAWPTADEISFAPGLDITLPSGVSPDAITDDLTIDGNGTTITGVPNPNQLDIRPLINHGGGDLIINHLTLAAPGTARRLISGGGRSLRVFDSVLLGGRQNPTSPFGTEGISETAPIVVDSSTIADNFGAAINSTASLGVINSTIVGNGPWSTTEDATIIVRGDAAILASTIADNAGDASTAAVDNLGTGTVNVLGSIIDQPASVGCAGPVHSLGYNLVSDSSCGFSQVGDRQGLGALLGPLADNGGPTPTRLPSAASPALDRIPIGTAGLCTSGHDDQRGVPRPVGPACDIGAVEGHGA